MRCYVDTSVLAAFYSPEPLSEVAEAFLTSVEEPVVSWLTEVELHSAIARKVRMVEMEETAARSILDAFRGHVEDGYYRRIALRAKHFEDARDRIATFSVPLRSLDALHLAIALEEEMELVTADVGLAAAMRRFGGEVHLLSVV